MWLSRKLGLDNKPHFCYNEYNKTREDEKMSDVIIVGLIMICLLVWLLAIKFNK